MEQEQEIWKYIENFPQYQVSNLGRILSLKNPKKPKILKGRITKKGYHQVHLHDINGKSYSKQVHRLVLETFSPKVDMKLLEVNHKDENKLNNNLSNLEWVTHTENVNYGTYSQRKSASQSDTIYCIETQKYYSSMRQASEETGVDYGNISLACSSGRTAGGYHWKNLTNKRKKTTK